MTETTTNAHPSNEMEHVNLTAIPSPPTANNDDDDDDVDSLLKELESPKRTTTTTTATATTTTNNQDQDEDEDEDHDNTNNTDPLLFTNIKVSSGRLLTSLSLLGTDLDHKFGLRDRARKIDERMQITAKSQQALETVSTKAWDLDKRYQITESTSHALGKIQTTIVAPTLDKANRHVRDFRESELSSKTATWMNSTADFVTNKVNHTVVARQDVGSGSGSVGGSGSTGTDVTPKPDFPSSFQN